MDTDTKEIWMMHERQDSMPGQQSACSRCNSHSRCSRSPHSFIHSVCVCMRGEESARMRAVVCLLDLWQIEPRCLHSALTLPSLSFTIL